jgi:hypothetical protein
MATTTLVERELEKPKLESTTSGYYCVPLAKAVVHW